MIKTSILFLIFINFFAFSQTSIFKIDFDANPWNPIISAPTDQNAAFYCSSLSGAFNNSCYPYNHLSGNRFVIRSTSLGLFVGSEPWQNVCGSGYYLIYQCYPSAGAPVTEKAFWQKKEINVEPNKDYTFHFDFLKLGTLSEHPKIKVMAIATNYNQGIGYRFYQYTWSDYFDVINNSWTSYDYTWSSGNAVKLWILIYAQVTNTNELGIALDNLELNKIN